MGGSALSWPAIAVVIPSHNRAEFLPATLESVFAQTDCPPFEVVLVDDASTDDTAAVVAAARHPIVYVRHERNRGVARARQTGVERSRAPLLAFHDSDDVMLPGRLGELARYLDAHPDVGAVFSNGIVGPDGHPPSTVVPPELAASLDGRRIGVRDILRGGLPMYLQTALIRREAFERAGGIDTTLVRHADLELGCRLAVVGTVVFLDRATFRYRLHGANQTRNRLQLREGLADVMQRLRTRHPECLEACGEAWYRDREKRHLNRIAFKHLLHARLLRAGAAYLRALTLGARAGRVGWRRTVAGSARPS